MYKVLAVGFQEHLGALLEHTAPDGSDTLRICDTANLHQALALLDAGEDAQLIIACLNSTDLQSLANVQRLRERYANKIVLALFDVRHNIAGAHDTVNSILSTLKARSAPIATHVEKDVTATYESTTGSPDHDEPPAPDAQAYHLTSRQKHVLNLIGKGLSNKRIAKHLGLSEGTVKVHCMAIFRELGVVNRTQAAIIAERIKLTPSLAEPTGASSP